MVNSHIFIYSFFPLIFPLAIITVAFAVYFLMNKQRNDVLRGLSRRFNGSMPRFSLYPSFQGEYQGFRFSIVLVPAGRNTPDYLQIFVLKPSFFKLTVYKENVLSTFGEKLGLVKEIKANDPEFDKEFLIFSRQVSQAETYLANSEIKAAIRELFARGFNKVLIDGLKIFVQKPRYSLGFDVTETQIEETLNRLIALSRGL
ncbi:MAG: hypothetical protein PHE58_05355 [Candidatus Omnitrophica bacterium]|nr:hypothetical protein [Candidatus Omnitrophota bacterium]